MPTAVHACLTAEAVAGYASGELSEQELELVEEHIDRCAMCRQLVSSAAEAELSAREGATFDPEVHVPTRGTPRGAAPALEPGTKVSRYVVGPLLGAGGMGAVYSAEDPTLGRRVALKVLRAGLSARSRGAEEVLRREAMAMARLAHPNVVGVYDLFGARGTTFVVMELIAGSTLREWLRAGQRSTGDVLDALVQAGRGLAAAHEQGLVHRDFKPENVLCAARGRVCVSDFGLARVAEAGDLRGVAGEGDVSTGIAGTPRYMAPEQRAGHRASAQSDQFSFCVVAHEALYGALPAAALRDDPRRTTPPRDEGRRAVPPRVRCVLARGLELDPRRRYPSMRELLDDLSHDPATRRRWMGLGVGALGCAVALGLVGRGRAAAPASGLCRGSDARLAGVWDGPRKDAIERAFLATGKAFAGEAWRGVSATLDAYAKSWAATRTEACRATRVAGDQSEQAMELRMQCLDERLRDLGALSDIFARADGQVVIRAFPAAQRLPRMSLCSDLETLGARVKPPADPVVAARVAGVRERIAITSALAGAGKYLEALPIALSALDEAEAIAFQPTTATTLYWAGRLQYLTGDWKSAEANLRRSALTADAAADDALRVRVLGELAHFEAEQASFDEVPPLRDAALAALGRLGADDEVETDLLESLAIADNASGKRDEGRAELERAIDLETRLYGERSWQVGLLLADLGDTYPGSDDRGLELARRALVIEENLLGADHPYIADAETGIGCSLVEQGHASEAEPHLRRSLALAEEGFGPEHPQMPWYLDNLAQTLFDEGKVAEAIPLYERAFAIDERELRPDHPRAFDPLVGLGQCYVSLGQPARAVPLLERALALPREDTTGPAVAEAEMTLALALDALRPAGPRALVLARDAEAIYEEDAEGARDKAALARAQAWLAKHTGR